MDENERICLRDLLLLFPHITGHLTTGKLREISRPEPGLEPQVIEIEDLNGMSRIPEPVRERFQNGVVE